MGLIGLLGYLPISMSSFGGVKWGMAGIWLLFLSGARWRVGLPLGWAVFLAGSLFAWYFSVDRYTSFLGLFGSRYNGIAQVICLIACWLIYRESRCYAKKADSWEIRLFRVGFLVNAVAGTVQAFNGMAVTGFNGHQVFYGQVMAVAGVYFFCRGQKAVALVGVLPILFTGSRGAALGVIAGMSVLWIGRRAAVALILPILWIFAGHLGYREMSLADQGRLMTWGLAVDRTSPFGTGIDTFAFKANMDKAMGNGEWKRIYHKGTTDHAHNSVLEALSSSGWVGLSCFLFLCGWIGIGVKDKAVFGSLLAGAMCSMVNPTPFDARLIMVALAASVWDGPEWGSNWIFPRYLVPLAASASFALFCWTTLIERISIADEYGLTGNSAVWAKKKLRILPIND